MKASIKKLLVKMLNQFIWKGVHITTATVEPGTGTSAGSMTVDIWLRYNKWFACIEGYAYVCEDISNSLECQTAILLPLLKGITISERRWAA